MKLPILSILAFFAFCCTTEQPELEGRWNATKYMRYSSDTISIEAGFDTDIEQTTVQTDSGIMVISHVMDSVISIEPTTKIDVLHFHFDDLTHGVLSMYDIDSERTLSSEDPRYTANNYNISTLSIQGRTYLIIDYHFNQFGRVLDTVEYQLISADELLISKDTLTRIVIGK